MLTKGLSPVLSVCIFCMCSLYSTTSLYCLYLLLCCCLSPAVCRFYHIWPFAAPCLSGFQDHFLPALPLAARQCRCTCEFWDRLERGRAARMRSDSFKVKCCLCVRLCLSMSLIASFILFFFFLNVIINVSTIVDLITLVIYVHLLI